MNFHRFTPCVCPRLELGIGFTSYHQPRPKDAAELAFCLMSLPNHRSCKIEGVGFSMLESKVRQQHLEPAQTAQAQPDIGPNVLPPTDVSMTRVLAPTSGMTHDSPAFSGDREEVCCRTGSYHVLPSGAQDKWPIFPSSRHTETCAPCFYLVFPAEDLTQNTSAAVAMIDTP